MLATVKEMIMMLLEYFKMRYK